MATTSITITTEAYSFLKSIKGNRSFSETIMSLSRSSEDILNFAGILKSADLNSIKKVRDEINENWDNRN